MSQRSACLRTCAHLPQGRKSELHFHDFNQSRITKACVACASRGLGGSQVSDGRLWCPSAHIARLAAAVPGVEVYSYLFSRGPSRSRNALHVIMMSS